jgi:hypothetical protein
MVGFKLRLMTDGAPRLDMAPSSLAGFGTAVLACCATEVGGKQERIYGARTLHEVDSWHFWSAELPGWPGFFPCKPVVLHPDQGSGRGTSHPPLARSLPSVRGRCCRLLGAQHSASREPGALS